MRRSHPLARLAPAALGALSLVVAEALALAILLTPTPAHACGGFFCQQLPMDQVGERIVFSLEEGRVRAVVNIQFEGEAESFAWVVPVPAKPTISLAPAALFQQLEWRTRPQWYLDWQTTGGQCGFFFPEASEDADGAGGGNGVEILDESEVGPYQTVTLDAEDPSALLDWLNTNGFDQPEESLDIMAHYLMQGMVFVAMKLKQDVGAGEIQPVVLDYPGDHPCVPLVLTRIAAQPDMPVVAWVMAEHRAVPDGWFHVLLNEKKIDWLNNGQNYLEVATQAIDEAAGHAFVTEFAGALQMQGALYVEGAFDLDALEATADPSAFLDVLFSQGFPRDAQMQALIRKHIPKPAEDDLPDGCKTDQEFYNWNKEECLTLMPAGWTFDPAAFVKDLRERVVEPLKAAQLMVEAQPYTTRLLTTVSPDEMTKDPTFALNPDLPDVSNVHTAKAEGECGEDGTVQQVTITLESGETFTLEGPFDPWGPTQPTPDVAPGEAAAREIQLLGPSGPPQVVDPADVAATEKALNASDPTYLPLEGLGGLIPNTPPVVGQGSGSSGPSGCQGGPGGAPLALMGALLLLAGLARRR